MRSWDVLAVPEFNRTVAELKPVYIVANPDGETYKFNRTVAELKLDSGIGIGSNP